VSIPHDYESHGKEMFDPQEMKKLFELGFEMAKSGYKWNEVPPSLRKTGEAEWIWTP